MLNFWNKRYCQDEFAYGTQPNAYLKAKLATLPIGKILFPADGEGRNSVYAALLGWQSEAFDSSSEGKKKADKLAKEKETHINYLISDVKDIQYPKNNFDILALIYAHFPIDQRSAYHQKLTDCLKDNGMLILEAFSENHIENQKTNSNAGGPRDVSMLYDLESLKTDFESFEFLEFLETEVELNEGNCHMGKATVIRIFAKKKEIKV